MASWEDAGFFTAQQHMHTLSIDKAWQFPHTPSLQKFPKPWCPTDTLLRSRQNFSPSTLASKLYNTAGSWMICLGFFLWTHWITNIYIFSSQTSTSNANFHYKIKLLKISFWIKCLSTYSWVWLMICKELYNFWKEKQKQLNVKIKFLTSKKHFHRVGFFFT